MKCHLFFIFPYFECQLMTKILQAGLSCCPPISISKLDFSHYKFEKIDKSVKCYIFIFTYCSCQIRSKKLQTKKSCCPPLSLSKPDFSQYNFENTQKCEISFLSFSPTFNVYYGLRNNMHICLGIFHYLC